MSSHFPDYPYNEGMRQRLSIVYTIVTVVFFLLLVVIFVLRLNAVREDNLSQASATLQVARKTAIAAFADNQVTSDSFRNAMRGIIQSDSAIQVLTVYSYNGGTEYLWARDRSYLPQGQQDIAHVVGIPQFQYNKLTSIHLTESFDGPGSRTYFVSAVFTVVGNGDIFPLLRDSLVLTLLFVLVTLLIMILLSITEQRTPTVTQEQVDGQTVTNGHPTNGNSGGHSPAPEENNNAEVPPAKPREGIVSARTGLSYREHLDRRLTLELERSAFHEQDLSALQIHFPGLRKRSDLYAQAAHLILSHFSFEDLAFEFDDESFFVILPNTELSVAIKSADMFRRETLHFVREQRIDAPQIGLSSRNGRITESAQIIKETRQAVAKAGEDPNSRIVGFHPDPQKYRAFVSGKVPAED